MNRASAQPEIDNTAYDPGTPTDLVVGGEDEHTLIVRVDNSRRPEGVPALKTDWWNDGGITRSVELVEVPRTFLRDAWLTMAPDGRLVGALASMAERMASAT
mgnify:CR=1 FL=1